MSGGDAAVLLRETRGSISGPNTSLTPKVYQSQSSAESIHPEVDVL